VVLEGRVRPVTGPSSPAQETLIVLVVLVVILLVRTWRQGRGVPFLLSRYVFRWGVYGLLLADVLVGEVLFERLPWYSWVGDLALVGGATALFLPYAERTTTFFRDSSGTLRYRVPIVAGLLYLALYGVRLGLEAVFVPTALGLSSSPAPLSPTGSAVLEIVDALFGVSAGLVFARSVATYRAWRRYLGRAPPEELRDPSIPQPHMGN
jgi:hypothetical protein